MSLVIPVNSLVAVSKVMAERDELRFGRRGFRLFEVVLMATILILAVGLLLPGLLNTRLVHRGRSEGANRLKNIALAIHNYNDAFNGRLPPLIDVGPKSLNNAALNSLFFNILPYIKNDSVFRIFNSNPTTLNYTNTLTGGRNPPPGGAAAHTIKEFLDPADQTVGENSHFSATFSLPWQPPAPFAESFTGRYATTSYAANALIFGSNDAGLPRTFKDGTSNTIMIAQRPQVCDPMDGSPPTYNGWAFGYYGPQTPAFALLTPDEPNGMPSTGMAAPELPLPKNWTANEIAVRLGRTSSPAATPNFATPFQRVVLGKPCDPRILGTPHSSGILVALADGSVRSAAPNISAYTFWAACTPDGNETLYTDW